MAVTQGSGSLRREVGAFSLMMTGLGSIIGSGWLFGAWRASQLAGAGAVWAWVLGAFMATTIAITYVELGSMLPESGGMVRFSHLSHGSLVGFIAAWANWITIVAVIPVEAEASVQYMASWIWPWAQALYVHLPDGHGELSPPGLGIAAGLVIIYFLLNFWGVKLFARSNATITAFKLVVPGLTGLTLIASGFDVRNFHALPGQGGGIDPAAVLTAVATAGIVFSFNGFQSPVNLAGEARNPARSVPVAVLGSIALATVIYVILQVAYLGAVPHAMLERTGWHGVDFRSPFAQLALLANLNWLALLLYADAFVSPSGTGITYTATTARMIYGMERNGTLPHFLGRLNPTWGIPRNAMWLNLVVSFLFLFFFRGWGTLAAVISVSTILSYLGGPVAAMTLRRTAPAAHRPLKVAALPVVACLAFIFATELLYWAKWPLTGEVLLLILIALPIYALSLRGRSWAEFAPQLAGAWWLILYLPCIAVVSWAGSPRFGGHGYLAWGWDLVVVAVIGLVFYLWGVRSGWMTPALEQAYGARLEVPPELAGAPQAAEGA
ncbi:MAG TPA: APC family permease [Steroidobacteraceae bacterium]|nr:APC family permease [Steroidobacteraceae bacterium]